MMNRRHRSKKYLVLFFLSLFQRTVILPYKKIKKQRCKNYKKPSFIGLQRSQYFRRTCERCQQPVWKEYPGCSDKKINKRYFLIGFHFNLLKIKDKKYRDSRSYIRFLLTRIPDNKFIINIQIVTSIYISMSAISYCGFIDWFAFGIHYNWKSTGISFSLRPNKAALQVCPHVTRNTFLIHL